MGTKMIKSRKKRTRDESGFTYMELVITLAILTALTAAAIPATNGWRINLRVDAVAFEVLSDLQKARSLAIELNKDVIVTFDIPSKFYSIYINNNDLGVDPSNLYKSVTLDSIAGGVSFAYYPGLGIDGQEITAAVIFGQTSAPIRCTFRPTGTALNEGAIYLIPSTDLGLSPARAKVLNVYLSGRISRWGYNSGWEEYSYD